MGTYKVYYTKFREKVQQVFPLFPEKARKNPPQKIRKKIVYISARMWYNIFDRRGWADPASLSGTAFA